MTDSAKKIFDQLMNTIDRANNLANSLHSKVEPDHVFTSDEDKEEYKRMLSKVSREVDRIKSAMGYQF